MTELPIGVQRRLEIAFADGGMRLLALVMLETATGIMRDIGEVRQ